MPRVISANENETLLDAFKGLGEKLQDRGVGRSERAEGRERERPLQIKFYTEEKKSSLLVPRKKLRLRIHRGAREPFLRAKGSSGGETSAANIKREEGDGFSVPVNSSRRR